MATHPHSAATNGHGNSGATRLDKLLAFHVEAAAAIRTTIGLLNGHATTAKTNGHATVLAEAIALDAARRANTAKAHKPKRPYSRAAVLAQRARTVKVLAAFSPTRPIAIATVAKTIGSNGKQMGIAPLVNAGYLKRRRDGLIRTAKAYVLNPFAAASE